MSYKFLNAAFALNLKQPSKGVIISLADRVTTDGICCCGIPDIAFRSGCSERSVKKALKILKDDLKIVKIGRQYHEKSQYILSPLPWNFQKENDEGKVQNLQSQNAEFAKSKCRMGKVKVQNGYSQSAEFASQSAEFASQSAEWVNHTIIRTVKEPSKEPSKEPVPPAANFDKKKFSMFLEWQPSDEDLKQLLFQSGGSRFTTKQIAPEWLKEFTAYWWAQSQRKYTQREWTLNFAKKAISYLRSPGLFDRLNGNRGTIGKNRQFDLGSKQLPDWAKIPSDDNSLCAWAKYHGYRDAYPREDFPQYRGALQRLVNERLLENDLAKISF